MLHHGTPCTYKNFISVFRSLEKARTASSLSGIHRGTHKLRIAAYKSGTGKIRPDDKKVYKNRGLKPHDIEASLLEGYRDTQYDHRRESGYPGKHDWRSKTNDYTKRRYMARDTDDGNPLSNNRIENESQSEPVYDRGRKLITEYSDTKTTRHTLPPWVRIPYTTAASQFLHGHSVVMAAIRARRRNLYKLYIVRTGTESDERQRVRLDSLKRFALAAGIKVKEMDASFLPMIDKLSGGRKHQNCLLEASPLPVVPVTALGTTDLQGTFDLSVAPQSDEDSAINSMSSGNNTVEYKSGGWRHPFLLFIDGVSDEGNLGAILRSAYLLGVDGVVIDSRRSAPLSSVTLKASSGAAEALPLYGVSQPYEFIKESKQSGWEVHAADMLDDTETTHPTVMFQDNRRGTRKPHSYSPLRKSPCILILGNEEQGISKLLKKLTDFSTGITAPQRQGDIDLDSLNVSVASALLCMHFLKKPETLTESSGTKLF